jgi:hypothetical protein
MLCKKVVSFIDGIVKSPKNLRRQPNLLVPKLSLGTQVDAKLSFANYTSGLFAALCVAQAKLGP